MRELKFRRPKYDANGFVNFDHLEITSDCIRDTRNPGFFTYGDWDQYTGLKDKAGKEIYEGDIIMFSSPVIEKTRILPITVDSFHGYRFMLGGSQLFNSISDSGEIIGNKHENPELLEV